MLPSNEEIILIVKVNGYTLERGPFHSSTAKTVCADGALSHFFEHLMDKTTHEERDCFMLGFEGLNAHQGTLAYRQGLELYHLTHPDYVHTERTRI